MKKLISGLKKEGIFAYMLLLPSILLLLGLVGYPLIYNGILSFQKLPINPQKPPQNVGFANYLRALTDEAFFHSVGTTLLYTAIVTAFSTLLGLLAALLLNRPFRGKKLVNAVIISSYVIPLISMVFCWKYLFNSIYGMVNYLVVSVLGLTDRAPLWFDDPQSAFWLACLFAVWKTFPYAYISFLAILQSIDRTLYEVAGLDGANAWQRFWAVTYPQIKPVLATVVSLRAIWTFYTYAQVSLLSSQVDVLGVYLYKNAFRLSV